MAQLKDLIVSGAARIIGKLFINDSVTAPTFIGKLQGTADKANSVAWSGITEKPGIPSKNIYADDHISLGRKDGSTVGSYSSAIGTGCTASSNYSHAEGANTTASASYSHAEGLGSAASGTGAHAEGGTTTASASYSHAEGYHTIAASNFQHVEGQYNESDSNNKYAHIVGWGDSSSNRKNIYTLTTDGIGTFLKGIKIPYPYPDGEDRNNLLSSSWICMGANNNIDDNLLGHFLILGDKNLISDGEAETQNSILVGDNNTITAQNSILVGKSNKTESGNCIILGEGNSIQEANNDDTIVNSVIIGTDNLNNGENSLVVGSGNKIDNNNKGYFNSIALGTGLLAYNRQVVIGNYNKATNDDVKGIPPVAAAVANAFVIGTGIDNSTRKNAFRVTGAGNVYATNATISTGADYAEYFEWADGNSLQQDRVGYFVTFDEKSPQKIKIANKNDYILGIVSGMPSVIGNGDEDWKHRYILDDFGRYIEEEYEYEEKIPTKEIDKEGNIIYKTEIKKGIKWKENPDYNENQIYICRDKRPEWSAIGMLGVLSVYDDGTCEVNGYCKCGDNGVATTSEKSYGSYRVIERIKDNIIKIVFK